MKKTKVIIPALGLLVLSTAASVTGTVAWFSANNKVTVNGMAVSTKVKGNLLIASSNTNDEGYSSDNFVSNTSSGILEPVSSIDGLSFYYTKEKVGGNGSTTDATLEEYTTQSDFETYYNITGADAYKDYTFYLKTTSDVANQKVIISRFNLLYNGAAIGTEKAWRAAVFAQKVNEGAAGAALAVGQLKTIVAPASAAYFTPNNAWDTTTAKATVTSLSSVATLDTIQNIGTTQRYYVVVRMFLEGEDTTCKNDTFALLNEEYTLNLECELSENDGASAMVSSTAAVVTQNNLTATVAQGALAQEFTSKQWQKKDNNGVFQDIPSATNDTYTGTAGDVVRCKVVVDAGIYYSNPETLAAT